MSEPNFEALLEHLSRSRGFDFSAYKRTSLQRRVDRRMVTLGVGSYDEYVDFLEVHPDEFVALFNTILINVTSFFRDDQVWAFIASDVIPALIAAKGPHDPIRIWSAACASGEETYTLAMLFAEALGEEAFRNRVKIYATDVDEQALAEARLASYSPRHVAGVSPDRLAKYFDRVNGNYAFSKELRRAVIFGRHDLIQDAPISRVDLVACRNALMYFNAETQTRVVARLYFALNDGGILLLGKAEILFNHATMFVPVDLKRRVYRATPKLNQRERLLLAVQTGRDEPTTTLLAQVRIREAAFDADVMPQIVIDAGGGLALTNDQARVQFALSSRDLGRPLQDLELSYRPAELRSALEQSAIARRPVTLKDVEWPGAGGSSRFMDIVITPLIDSAGAVLGQKVSFEDVTQFRRLQQELAHSKQELETAMEELQSTNEELETTNEELQSTVEELETTNEELQSTNEELETMNEELQSTNEELHTMNEELRNRSGELNEVNSFFGSILAGLRGGVVVVDRDLRIQVWNKRAEDLWGVYAEEARGAHLFSLDIGLPLAELKATIKDVLTGSDGNIIKLVQATNRRGRPFQCRVTCSSLRGNERTVAGAIIIMEDQRELDGASSDASGDGSSAA